MAKVERQIIGPRETSKLEPRCHLWGLWGTGVLEGGERELRITPPRRMLEK